MNKYLKILIITTGIQLGSVALGMILANLSEEPGSLSAIGTVLFLFGFLISIVADIVLAIKWGTNTKEKLIYIFLMPTNYTWIVYVLFAFWYVGQWLDILNDLPDNFG